MDTADPKERLKLLPSFRQPRTQGPTLDQLERESLETDPQTLTTPAQASRAAGSDSRAELYVPGDRTPPATDPGPTRTAISATSDTVKKPSTTETAALIAGVIGLAAAAAAGVVRWRTRRKLRQPSKGEARDIATPLARIALRHFSPDWLNADLADGLAAATATAAYLGDGPLLLGADLDAGVPDNLQEEPE